MLRREPKADTEVDQRGHGFADQKSKSSSDILRAADRNATRREIADVLVHSLCAQQRVGLRVIIHGRNLCAGPTMDWRNVRFTRTRKKKKKNTSVGVTELSVAWEDRR